jgi:hypothetical protein
MSVYQPKIRDDLILRLYQLAKARSIPMTRLVNQMLTNSLNRLEEKKAESLAASDELADPRQVRRWCRALSIAKILFEEEGYHTVYLEEIEQST